MPIDFRSDGNRHSLKAGDAVDAELADLVHEGMDAPVQVIGTALPFGPPLTISPPTKATITAFGLDLDSSGKHGTTARIEWSG